LFIGQGWFRGGNTTHCRKLSIVLKRNGFSQAFPGDQASQYRKYAANLVVSAMLFTVQLFIANDLQ
jgi:hypothetical protein